MLIKFIGSEPPVLIQYEHRNVKNIFECKMDKILRTEM